TSATSAGGHSRKISRSGVKLRASITLLISGYRILPTITVDRARLPPSFNTHSEQMRCRIIALRRTNGTARRPHLFAWNFAENGQYELNAGGRCSLNDSAPDRR